MKKTVFLPFILAGLIISYLFPLSSVKAKDLTPYQTVVLASGINFCGTEYGVITDKQAYRYILEWVKDDHGLKPYQVYNLMQRKSFATDTDEFIEKMGGCQQIVADIQKELERKPTGFTSSFGKKEYKYYYGIAN